MGKPRKNGAQPEQQPETTEDADMQMSADIAAETMTGDLRDFILDRLEHEQNKKPWHMRSEAEQRDVVHAVEAAVRSVVTHAVQVIAAGGRKTMSATLSSVQVKDGMKGVLEMSRFDPLHHLLTDSVGQKVLIVVADPEEFDGERGPAKVTPDQSDLVEEAMTVHSETSGAAEQAGSTPFH